MFLFHGWPKQHCCEMGTAGCWHYQGLNFERFQRLRLKLEICQLYTLLCIMKFEFCTLLVIVNVCSVTCLDNYCDCAEYSLQIYNLFLLLKLALFEFSQDTFGLDLTLFCWQSIFLSWNRGVEDKKKKNSRTFVMTLGWVNEYRIFYSFKLTCHCQFFNGDFWQLLRQSLIPFWLGKKYCFSNGQLHIFMPKGLGYIWAIVRQYLNTVEGKVHPEILSSFTYVFPNPYKTSKILFMFITVK